MVYIKNLRKLIRL